MAAEHVVSAFRRMPNVRHVTGGEKMADGYWVSTLFYYHIVVVVDVFFYLFCYQVAASAARFDADGDSVSAPFLF